MRNRLTLNAIRNYEWAPTERQPGGHCLDCETLAFNPLRVYDTYLRIFHYDERRGDRPIFLLPTRWRLDRGSSICTKHEGITFSFLTFFEIYYKYIKIFLYPLLIWA